MNKHEGDPSLISSIESYLLLEQHRDTHVRAHFLETASTERLMKQTEFVGGQLIKTLGERNSEEPLPPGMFHSEPNEERGVLTYDPQRGGLTTYGTATLEYTSDSSSHPPVLTLSSTEGDQFEVPLQNAGHVDDQVIAGIVYEVVFHLYSSLHPQVKR